MGEEMEEKGKIVPPSAGAAAPGHFEFLWSGKKVTVYASPNLDGEGDPWCWSCEQCQWIKDANTKCKVDGADLDYYDGPLRTKACYEAETAHRARPSEAGTLPDSTPTPTERKEP